MSASEIIDQHYIGELYKDHHSWLLSWLRRKLDSPEFAADISHDVFVKLLTREENKQIHEPRAFLTTIARRSLANHWRHQQIEQAYLDALRAYPEPLHPSEEERAVIIEAIVEINARLDGLPAVVKRAFLYSQLDGMRYKQIAEKLNISISTVKRYLIQAAAQCYFAINLQ